MKAELTLETKYHPDCVLVPSNYDDLIVASFYEQIGTDEIWKGGLQLLRFDKEEFLIQELQFSEAHTGIFDLEEIPDSQASRFYSGYVDGKIRVSSIAESKITTDDVFALDKKIIYLNLLNTNLLTMLSDGSFVLLKQSTNGELCLEHEFKEDDNTIWAGIILEGHNSFIVGGDFGEFKLYDLNSPYEKVSKHKQ